MTGSLEVRALLPVVAFLLLMAGTSFANNNVHVAIHRHLHQPVYWGEPDDLRPNQSQYAQDSQRRKEANLNWYGGAAQNPENQLQYGENSVFGKADRINAYQFWIKSSIGAMTGADSGMTISYSGALQRNVWSFGRDNNAGNDGYGGNWNTDTTTARSWKTRSGTGSARADMLGMTYHHALGPLVPKSVLRKEVAIQRERMWKSWGMNPNMSDQSRGFWPVELAFSRHMIPVLREFNYDWVLVANSHLARTCPNYMDIIQTPNIGAELKADPPNPADQLGPVVPANQWYGANRDTFGNVFPVPFAYQAHKAKYVDPETGVESKITIVPACDYHGYESGYAAVGWTHIDGKIAQFNDPNRPALVLLANDGDNFWGGGHSFWNEFAPQFMNDAPNHGDKRATTVQQFLDDHPVPDTAVVHVEDGSWLAADQGSPQFYRWLEPPRRLSGVNPNDPFTFYDIENGWHVDMRNWAVLLAGVNFCETAEQLIGPANVHAWKIEEPYQDNGTWNNLNIAEQAWHFLLWGFDSGFMYFGTGLDDEVKQTFAANRAAGIASNLVFSSLASDTTPPTVFKPQRFPWNPGGKGKGQYLGDKTVGFTTPPWPSDFYIWTLAFDVSGLTNVTLKIRVDDDGVNPLADNANETYAGGPGVGSWISLPMTKRVLPKTDPTSDSTINFFRLPDYMCDYYWAKVTGHRNKLLDYYVEAYDARGNVHKSDIQHVWVADDGSGPPQPPPTPTGVTATAIATNRIDVSWAFASGATGYIVRRGGAQIATTSATGYADIGLQHSTQYCYTIVATNSVGASAESSPACATTPSPPPPGFIPPFVMDGTNDFPSYLQSSPGMTLYAAVRGQTLYVATWSTGNGGHPNDHFIFVTDQLLATASAPAPWAKTGQVAVATTKPFIGAEADNTFVGWFNAPAGSPVVKAPTSAGALEGTIDLVAAFGPGIMTGTVYVASAAYSTPNGGPLVAQAPAAVTVNGNIESNEFLALSIPALLDNNGDGIYDRLDPAIDFVITGIEPAPGGGCIIRWNSTPGKTNQLMYADSPQGPWNNLGPPIGAGPGQLSLSYTNNTTAAQRYYKVKCVNP